MKSSELKTKSEKELKKLLEKSSENLQKLRFDLSFNRLKNVKEVSKIKKEIARIKTLLNKK